MFDGRLLAASIASGIIRFLALLLYSIYTFPSGEVLASDLWPYAWSHSTVLFTRGFMAIMVSVLLIAGSLLLRPRVGMPTPRLGPVAMELVVLSALYALFTLALGPTAANREWQARSLGRVALEALERGTEASNRRDWARAETYLQIYVNADPGASHASDLLAASRAARSAARPASVTGAVVPAEVAGYTAAELAALARQQLQAGDPAGAYYYAVRARQLRSSAEIQGLLDTARQQLLNPLPGGAERQTALFRRKREGFQAFEDGDFRSAYYIFSALTQQSPADPDVVTFTAASRSRLERTAFFVDEAEPFATLPGIADAMMAVPTPDGATSVVRAASVTRLGQRVYFTDVEVVLVGADGEILRHHRAPFGKLLDGDLSLDCLDPVTPESPCAPLLLAGTAESWNYRVRLGMSPDQLILALRTELARDGGAILARQRALRERLGLESRSASLGLLQALLGPLDLLVLVVCTVTVAWVGRHPARDGRRYLGLASMPLMIPVAIVLLQLLQAGRRPLLTLGVIRLGDTVTLAAAGVADVLVLVLALIAFGRVVSEASQPETS